jgi:hypothetical protein
MPILMVEVLTDIKGFVTTRTHRQESTPAPSVGSAMEGLPETILSEDRPALAVSTAAAEGSTAAVEDSTEVGATDSSHEVIKP